MDLDSIVILIDQEVYRYTNKHLTNLQQAIITQVWQNKTYLEIADEYGCTEGHAKDTGSLLWKLLSQAWGKKVTKGNCRSLITRQLKSRHNFEPVITQQDNLSNNALVNSVNSEKSDFVGREQEIANLQDLVSQNYKIIVLQGNGISIRILVKSWGLLFLD